MTVNFQTSAVILVCLVNLIFLALPQVLVLERAEGFLQFRSSVSPDEEEESQACGDKQISQAKCLLQWKPSYLSPQQFQCLWARDGSLRPMGSKGFPG